MWVALAAFVGVYVTEQLPLARVQVVLLKLPVASLENVIVPAGVDDPVPEVSPTVAVQVVACATVAGDPQLTDVLVFRLLTPRANVLLLGACEVSPE